MKFNSQDMKLIFKKFPQTTLVRRFIAVPVAFVKSKTTQLNASASLTAPKKTIHAERSAPTETRHGEAIAKFIASVASATLRTIAAATPRTHTFTSTITANARNCR